jgi:peptidyl-tRNA hydrolase
MKCSFTITSHTKNRGAVLIRKELNMSKAKVASKLKD